jgi:hypothetical protein
MTGSASSDFSSILPIFLACFIAVSSQITKNVLDARDKRMTVMNEIVLSIKLIKVCPIILRLVSTRKGNVDPPSSTDINDLCEPSTTVPRLGEAVDRSSHDGKRKRDEAHHPESTQRRLVIICLGSFPYAGHANVVPLVRAAQLFHLSLRRMIASLPSSSFRWSQLYHSRKRTAYCLHRLVSQTSLPLSCTRGRSLRTLSSAE